MIVFVLAVDENFGIGKGNELPWSFKKDMQFFKALTEGFQVAIGRKTWEAIKEPSKGLPGRRKIVIGNCELEDAYEQLGGGHDTLHFRSTSEIVSFARSEKPESTIMVIGGKQLYESLYEHVDFAVVTQVHGKFDCDVFVDSALQKLLPKPMVSYKVNDINRVTQNPVELSFTIFGNKNATRVPEPLCKAWWDAFYSVKEWFEPAN